MGLGGGWEDCFASRFCFFHFFLLMFWFYSFSICSSVISSVLFLILCCFSVSCASIGYYGYYSLWFINLQMVCCFSFSIVLMFCLLLSFSITLICTTTVLNMLVNMMLPPNLASSWQDCDVLTCDSAKQSIPNTFLILTHTPTAPVTLKNGTQTKTSKPTSLWPSGTPTFRGKMTPNHRVRKRHE